MEILQLNIYYCVSIYATLKKFFTAAKNGIFSDVLLNFKTLDDQKYFSSYSICCSYSKCSCDKFFSEIYEEKYFFLVSREQKRSNYHF